MNLYCCFALLVKKFNYKKTVRFFSIDNHSCAPKFHTKCDAACQPEQYRHVRSEDVQRSRLRQGLHTKVQCLTTKPCSALHGHVLFEIMIQRLSSLRDVAWWQMTAVLLYYG